MYGLERKKSERKENLSCGIYQQEHDNEHYEYMSIERKHLSIFPM